MHERRQQPEWFLKSFKAQQDFIEDPAALCIALCTRRAGKSYGAGLKLIKTAYERPGVSCLYIALTQESAYRIMWKDVLKAIDRQFNLGIEFRETKMTAILPNGSVIYLSGADNRKDEMDKLLGQKYAEVIIDEAFKYRIDTHALIHDILEPATADYNGRITLIGTPNNFVQSYPAKIIKRDDPRWSIHRWTALDNPHIRENFKARMDSILKNDPEAYSSAWFRQNYLGELVVDTRDLIYKFDPASIIDEMPDSVSEWRFVLGVSYSHRGFIGLVVWAYSEDHREAFLVESYRVEDHNFSRAVEEAAVLNEFYQFTEIVSTGISTKLLDELQGRFGIAFSDPGVLPKAEMITLFNDELKQDNIKVLSKNTDIVVEWEQLTWDSKTFNGGQREHPLADNFLANAALYSWYNCFNFNYQPVTSKDEIDEYWDKLADRIKRRRLAEDNPDDYEYFDSTY